MNFLKALQLELRRLRGLIYSRFFENDKRNKNVVDDFHKLYAEGKFFNKTWGSTYWMGVPTQKCPLDMWIYQEIINEVKPDVILESGTAAGGSALFLAGICDLVDKGRVVSIDIKADQDRPKHDRIDYLHGSSTSDEIYKQIKSMIRPDDIVMVVWDSDHVKDHVLQGLRMYSPLVTRNSYFVVEDTNLNGNPIAPDWGPGPMEAVEEFILQNKDFLVDKSKEKFYMTFNPSGYLKRIR